MDIIKKQRRSIITDTLNVSIILLLSRKYVFQNNLIVVLET